MVLPDINFSVQRGAPSASTPPQTGNANEMEVLTSPTLSYVSAVKGTLEPHDPGVVKVTQTATLNVNSRPAVPDTSAPKHISILTDPLDPTPPVEYRICTTENSIFYTVPPHLRHLDIEFINLLRDKFPFGVGYVLHHKEEGNSLAIEVGLSRTSFPATRAFSSSLTRFNFSGIPGESPIDTRDNLISIFSRYGKVQDWFRGNGHVLVDMTSDPINQPNLTYKMDYNDKTHILVTWAKMPKFCRY
ncbi:hypothetical protein BY458DRAFT_528596, partial [Sporodiniella umbellata]